MKKIDYVKPMIRVYVMEDTCSLPETSGGDGYADPEEDPGDLYDEIEIGEGYCKTPD